MTTNEARNLFNKAINETTDKNQIAKLELAREYFTNPDFRKALEEESFKRTRGN